jgi:hypothetical protein
MRGTRQKAGLTISIVVAAYGGHTEGCIFLNMEPSMPKILFSVDIPPVPNNISGGDGYAPNWTQFSMAAEPLLQAVKGLVLLQQNVWLMPAENGLPLVSLLINLAKRSELSYSSVLVPDGDVVLALDVTP